MTASAFCDKLRRIAEDRRRLVLLILSGVLTSLALVFPILGLLEWITLAPMGIVIIVRGSNAEVKLRALYLDGLVFFYSFYLVAFHWFINLYPLDFIGGMTKISAAVVVAVAWLGLSLLQALMGGLAFVVLGILFRLPTISRHMCLSPFLCGGVWSVYEWTQTLGWWGVPWGRLPIGQSTFLWGMQNASLFGSYFVTFMLVSVNLLFAVTALKFTFKKLVRFSSSAALCLIMLQYASGGVLWLANGVDRGDTLKVACIQGNISSAQKWETSHIDLTLSRYLEYSREAAEQGAELIIWAETAFPYNIDTSEGTYSDMFKQFTKKYGVYMLVGAFEYKGDTSYNSLFCFTPDGERLKTTYAKRHLVPFGEYVPMRSLIEILIPPLAELVLSSDDIYPGEGAQIIEIEKDGETLGLGSLICFDSIYETLTLETVKAGGEVICLATNDSWFTDSAALYMHNAQAQLRAVESGRYVARAANTGISTVINSRGEILASLPPLEGGYIVEDVRIREVRTLYSMIGNSFVYIMLTVLTGLILIETFSMKKSKKP